jgi:excisionase family DNA binding protein
MASVVKIDREWFDITELTQYASVSDRTLRSWIHSPVDPLPAVQVGSKILVRRLEFDAWLEQHRVRTIDSVDIGGIVNDVLGDT